jgi:hypothetical protein
MTPTAGLLKEESLGLCPALLGAGMRMGREPIGARGMFHPLKWEVRSSS